MTNNIVYPKILFMQTKSVSFTVKLVRLTLILVVNYSTPPSRSALTNERPVAEMPWN